MDTMSNNHAYLVGGFEWIENWEPLSVLSEAQLRKLYNHIGSFCLKHRLGYNPIKSLKFSQMTKTETEDQEGKLFDLYHLEFDYTVEGSDQVKQAILITW